jgi:hypothetical protein
LYFVVFTADFILCVVFMVWYSRFMFQRIYGDTRGKIDSIVSGSAPPEWEQKLAKKLSRCGTERKKSAVIGWYKKFADRRIMDLIGFMKSTSVVESEAERDLSLERLESFRREYPAVINSFAGSAGDSEIGAPAGAGNYK